MSALDVMRAASSFMFVINCVLPSTACAHSDSLPFETGHRQWRSGGEPTNGKIHVRTAPSEAQTMKHHSSAPAKCTLFHFKRRRCVRTQKT
jgi:hypothetical protein